MAKEKKEAFFVKNFSYFQTRKRGPTVQITLRCLGVGGSHLYRNDAYREGGEGVRASVTLRLNTRKSACKVEAIVRVGKRRRSALIIHILQLNEPQSETRSFKSVLSFPISVLAIVIYHHVNGLESVPVQEMRQSVFIFKSVTLPTWGVG